MRGAHAKWLAFAKRDLDSARHSLESGDYYVAAFLGQQAAEKSLKAANIKMHGQLLKIHDLVFLAKKAGAPDEIISECKKLNPVYLALRYPDAEDESPGFEYGKTDAQESIMSAKKVVAWTKKA